VGLGKPLQQFDSYIYEKVYDVSASFSHMAEKLSLPQRPSYGSMTRFYTGSLKRRTDHGTW
jgi:hypothetical protein